MLENFYNSTRIKKKLPKQKDEQFQYTLMKISKHFMIAAGTGGGKTNALYSYIIETSKPKNGTFKHIYVLLNPGIGRHLVVLILILQMLYCLLIVLVNLRKVALQSYIL